MIKSGCMVTYTEQWSDHLMPIIPLHDWPPAARRKQQLSTSGSTSQGECDLHAQPSVGQRLWKWAVRAESRLERGARRPSVCYTRNPRHTQHLGMGSSHRSGIDLGGAHNSRPTERLAMGTLRKTCAPLQCYRQWTCAGEAIIPCHKCHITAKEKRLNGTHGRV